MRDNVGGTTGFSVVQMAVALVIAMLVSGCASKGARHESSLYPTNSRTARLLPPRPAPAVRGYKKRVTEPSRAPVMANDEARYSAVYGVAPRPDYLRNPAIEARLEPDPLPRGAVGRRMSARTGRFATLRGPRPDAAGRARTKQIIVTRGDTLHNIAWRYKTTVKVLVSINQLTHANLEIGQELNVPAR